VPESDGLIDSSNLCSQAVVERILGDASVSSVKIANNIQSDNFVTGSSGWRIERNTGSAEFQDATIRGTLNASDITAGTMSVSYLAAGTLSVSGTVTVASGSDIESSNYVAGTSGWQIDGAGNAEFNNVTVRGQLVGTSGSLSGLSITGVLTLSGSGEIQTASSGQRIEITATDNDLISFYSGGSNETSAANIQTSVSTNDPSLYINGPRTNSVTPDFNVFYMHSENRSSYGFDLVSTKQSLRLYSQDATEAIEFWLGSKSAEVDQYGVMVEDGSATNPSFGFFNDAGVGMYKSGTDEISWASNTSQVMTLSSTTFSVDVSGGITLDASGAATYDAAGNHYFLDGGQSVFAMWWDGTYSALRGRGGSDYLLYHESTEQWKLRLNGTDELTIGTAGFLVPNVYSNTQSGSANVLVDSSGSIKRATSSIRLKRNVEPLNDYRNVLEIEAFMWDGQREQVVMKPLTVQRGSKAIDDQTVFDVPQRYKSGSRKGEVKREIVPTGIRQAGMVAEYVYDAHPLFATRNEKGEPSSLDLSAIVAALLEVVKDHDVTLNDLKENRGLSS
jgi:hypothetical protein